MKKITALFVLVALLSACKRSKYNSDWYKFTFDDLKRKNLIHVPDSYDGSEAVSLILAFHGGFGSPVNIEKQSQLSLLSDQEGFIVCYPEGLHHAWNAGWCCGKPMRDNYDDVGMVSALIDKLLDEYNIDPKRVYATGMSNGAFMSYRLACELSDKIAAVAPVEGTMNIEVCNPSEPVPIIHFHSYMDTSVPYEGGVGDGPSDHYNTPLDSVFTVWSGYNGCMVDDTLIYSGSDYDHWQWKDCNNNAIIEFYISHDGGHQWPMGVKPRKGADDPSQAFNANQLMWEFFQAHPKP